MVPKKILRIITLTIVISTVGSCLYSAQEAAFAQANEHIQATLQEVQRVLQITNNIVFRGNEAMALAHGSNAAAIKAFKKSKKALAELEKAQKIPENIHAQAQDALAKLEELGERLKKDLLAHNGLDLAEKIQLERAKIQEKLQLGIYQQEELIRAQVAVDVEKTKWDRIANIIDDPKRIIKIVLAITAIALGVYAAKHAVPKLIDYFARPRVITETSKKSWLCDTGELKAESNDLFFSSFLHKQLSELSARIQSAQQYHEKLPNMLFYGAPGTGKTAFVRMLAYTCKLDYALTSGSEFAKITDLDSCNNELRKLLEWAKNSDKGLIIFIDEAESLFADRKLQTTPKIVHDFINTFLALIPERSQHNVMFIFATNAPFKLDEAITDRIGITIEFTLPQAEECEKILNHYLQKYALENADAIVPISKRFMTKISKFAQKLEGLSPRAIQSVAEEMVVCARRQKDKKLTEQIAQSALDDARRSLQQKSVWAQERERWVASLSSVSA